jgi:hypothetical protein
MGTVILLEYETWDHGAAESVQKGTETSAGSVEHNKSKRQDVGSSPQDAITGSERQQSRQ